MAKTGVIELVMIQDPFLDSDYYLHGQQEKVSQRCQLPMVLVTHSKKDDTETKRVGQLQELWGTLCEGVPCLIKASQG